MRRPSPALVIACLGLFVSLGGTGYAVSSLPKNSVGAKQVRANAISSKKVKDHSLTAADLDLATLPKGGGDSAPPPDHVHAADIAGHADAASKADSAAKAGDADKLGGHAAADFVQGGGSQRINRIDLPAGTTWTSLLDLPGLGRIEANCSGGAQAALEYRNTSAEIVDMSYDQLGASSEYWTSVSGGNTGGVIIVPSIQNAAQRGTWQVGRGTSPLTGKDLATVVATAVSNISGTNKCRFQAAATVGSVSPVILLG
jgi:hypothetical protein